MMVIPWEIILSPNKVIIYLNLHDTISSVTSNKSMEEITKSPFIDLRKQILYTFVIGYNNEQIKYEDRKQWTCDYIFSQLKIGKKFFYDSSINMQYPYHSNMIGSIQKEIKKKYKYCNTYDISTLSNPRDIISIIQSVDNPAFILNYTEMLEMSETLLQITRYKKTNIINFFPWIFDENFNSQIK